MPNVKAPTMQRSRNQIATAYAPHSLFTFEGGRGACMALPSGSNRTIDLPLVTKKTIGEQIQEYFSAWAERAHRGNNLGHAVPPELAVDRRVLTDGAVHVRIGELAFQIPDYAEYRPFPLAFTCTRCGLHRESRGVASIERDAESFKSACPGGSATCADDWEQLDVVLTHWSGEIEPISPSYRHWQADRQEIVNLDRCRHCDSDRFYLRRPPGALAGWHFECVKCHTTRQILQRDKTSLKALASFLDAGTATWAEINMEPVSYRASAAYYVHGDRLLVFQEDKHLALLGDGRVTDLQRTISNTFGYPAASLGDAEKQDLLKRAGREKEWDEQVQLVNLLRLIESQNLPEAMLEAQRNQIRKKEADWSATVFAAHGQAAPGIAAACRGRVDYVRRHDPLRMSLEHLTLKDEKLRGGQMADGKEVSVDVTILDDFLKPDDLQEADLQRLRSASARSLAMLGIDEMRLIRDVKICEYSFAYSRTSSAPSVQRDKAGTADLPVRLRLFDKVEVSDLALHPVLCTVQSNEGFYVRLDEQLVRNWLEENAVPVPAADAGVRLGGQLIEDFEVLERDDVTRFSRFLDEYKREGFLPRRAYPFVYTLLHTMAHHLVDTCSEMSGLDLGSFGEHLFVPDLAFLVYRRGTTMDLGNLSSMWRDRGDPDAGNHVLQHMLSPSSLRCGSESVCNRRGGACPDCVLLPENACLTRNELLSRSVLVGRGRPRWDAGSDEIVGYLNMAASRR
ncbi:MAG: hypothetical protein JNL14_06540 [Devosia sp.]|uniref:hypothetical protein n=1 Tax=Devosia sp. TaxID=1871048 RepID=UPI001A5A8D2B|nr:hypothetical protein [Devosia sp.]MBL8597379.1 hypothetical protein [Devosia sp.]